MKTVVEKLLTLVEDHKKVQPVKKDRFFQRKFDHQPSISTHPATLNAAQGVNLAGG